MGASPAAVVDGHEISQRDVQDLAEATNRFFQQAVDAGLATQDQVAPQLSSFAGSSPSTIGVSATTDALQLLIQLQVVHDELDRHDALPTADDRKAARTSLESQVGGADKLKKLDAAYIDYSVESQALITAYQAWLASEQDKGKPAPNQADREQQLRDLYAQMAPTRPLCLNAILTTAEQDAADARAQVEGGTSFGDVAKAVSVEPTSAADGGFAGCASYESAQQAFGTDFTGLAVGTLVGPVPYASAQGTLYAVLQVAGTDGPTFEQLRPQLEAALPDPSAATDPTTVDVSTPVSKLLDQAAITVDPRFGTWDAQTLAVVPPRVPGTPTTTSSTIPTAPSTVTTDPSAGG